MNLAKFKSTIIEVSMSTPNPAKRQATTINSQGQRSSASPKPETTSKRHLPDAHASPVASSNDNSNRPSAVSIAARTIALCNIPDTINDARVRALVEPYGPITKLTLRPDHQGAIVEFADTQAAGKASLGVEGHEIAPGRKLRVVTVKELLQEKPEVRASDKIVVGGGGGPSKDKKKSAGGAPTGMIPNAQHIRRPQITPAERRGGRGGLGFKRGGGGLGGERAKLGAGPTTTTTTTKPSEDQDTAMADPACTDEVKKSNADFRAMFSSPATTTT